jgi:hypothetical protein
MPVKKPKPKTYRLRPRAEVLSEIPFDVRLMWALGILSKMLNVPKKHLRTALEIIKNPEMEAEILEKGKVVKRTFHFGFRKFKLVKKRKERQILAPHPKVQLVFQGIKNWLESLNPSHKNAFGFVKGKNPKMAVKSLLGNRHFIGFDIADAFPSITVDMVTAAFKRINVKESFRDVLAWLVTYEYDGQRRLPQGSACSPVILNLVYKPMCDEIQEICRQHEINWNVYADDFNLASRYISPELKEELLSIPAKHGFLVKERKTRDNSRKTIPHVLGLTVVYGVIHINRKTKNKIRRIIYAAMTKDAYTSEQVAGLIGHVRHIYGEEENWPGSILNVYRQYQREEES